MPPTDDEVRNAQEELYALVLAWADRGLTFTESTMIVAATAHKLLAMTEFKLEDVVQMVSDAWMKNGGKV